MLEMILDTSRSPSIHIGKDAKEKRELPIDSGHWRDLNDSPDNDSGPVYLQIGSIKSLERHFQNTFEIPAEFTLSDIIQ